MGLKRFFDEENLQGLSVKHPKQLYSGEQLISLTESNHSYGASQKAEIPGDAMGIFRESHLLEGSKHDSGNVVSNFIVKEVETSAPISWVTNRISEEDARSRAVFCSSASPEHFEFNFPRRNCSQFEDTYSYLLNSSPRKEVPLGPDHQVDVPEWDLEVIKKHSLSSTDGDDNANGEIMTGACVIPMPNINISADVGKIGCGRLDCSCLDGGSVKCVQQHVKEAREELKKTIGHKAFMDLGFFEMGEEVAQRWTEEEERVFHEVVYSNPMLHGKNFWVTLSIMFPSRTKKELVSYYFNVFMLRRRAAQNRSRWLEIDSDDDEWKVDDGGRFGVIEEDEDPAVASFINRDVLDDHGDDSQNECSDDGNDSDSNDDNSDDDGGDGDGNLEVVQMDSTQNDEARYDTPKGELDNSLNGQRSDFGLHRMDRTPNVRELLDFQDDSCTSFEGQAYMADSYGPIGEGAAGLQERKASEANGKCLHSDRFDPQYALETCDTKVWDATYSTGLMKSVDLLPTCNMMEEIFGPCNWNSKSSNDKSIS